MIIDQPALYPTIYNGVDLAIFVFFCFCDFQTQVSSLRLTTRPESYMHQLGIVKVLIKVNIIIIIIIIVILITIITIIINNRTTRRSLRLSLFLAFSPSPVSHSPSSGFIGSR